MIMNLMKIDKYSAVVNYDPEIEMFRGEFVGLNGGADFYAADVKALKKEAKASLNLFLETCKDKGIEPVKNYSGKFNVRFNPELHEALATYAEAEHKSLNTIVSDTMTTIVNLAKQVDVSISDVQKYIVNMAELQEGAAKPKKRPVARQAKRA